MRQPDLHGGDGDNAALAHKEDDAWTEARALVDTIDADELTDPQVGIERLLFRLFHERGVRVFSTRAVFDRCSCSREKIKNRAEGLFGRRDRRQPGERRTAVTCEFCSTTYRFEVVEVASAAE